MKYFWDTSSFANNVFLNPKSCKFLIYVTTTQVIFISSLSETRSFKLEITTEYLAGNLQYVTPSLQFSSNTSTSLLTSFTVSCEYVLSIQLKWFSKHMILQGFSKQLQEKWTPPYVCVLLINMKLLWLVN